MPPVQLFDVNCEHGQVGSDKLVYSGRQRIEQGVSAISGIRTASTRSAVYGGHGRRALASVDRTVVGVSCVFAVAKTVTAVTVLQMQAEHKIIEMASLSGTEARQYVPAL